MPAPYLTGLTRIRPKARLFRPPLMVLQVQVKTDSYVAQVPSDGYWPGEKYVRPEVIEWRDATLEDITVANAKMEL